MTARRRGFALITVLWVIAGASVIALGEELVARNALAAARDRIELTRAAWRAEECAEQARAVIGRALASGKWDPLDTIVRAARAPNSDCDVTLRAAGARLNVNTAEAPALHALFGAIGIPAGVQDSLVDALLDWRDPDTIPRPHGAERSWYIAHGLPVPRDGPFGDARELRLVRGFSSIPGLDTLFDVDSARTAITHAPFAVLVALPGFDAQSASQVIAMRARGAAYQDPLALGASLGATSRSALLDRYSDLAATTTASPDAWILTSSATMGTPPVTATLELRLVRSGARAAIVRRRTWIQ